MESPSHLLPVPRLRLSRHNLDNQNAHPITHAGPSRLSDTPLNTNLNIASYDDEDQVATPRVSASNTLPSSSPVETPAARLRALLSRAQNTPNTRTPMPHTPAPVSPSVLESDFDPPDFGPGTPSIARDSLKGIFSRALRDPGDTPQKGRKRSNSVDVSEVEASPRVEKERSINKGKRRSMSDEEVETTSKSQRSESSFRSNAFHNLRERLTNTQTQLKDELHPSTTHEHTTADDSHDTATLLRDLNSSLAAPPAATSTPQQSLRMSMNSQFPFQSNLLEQDSEMQRAIAGFDSYDQDSGPSQRPLSFPPARVSGLGMGPSPARSRSPLHTKSSSLDKTEAPNKFTRRTSGEFPRRSSGELSRSSSRASSTNSSSGYSEHHSNEQDHSRVREREWNKPRPKTPARSDTPELNHQSSHGRLSRNGLVGGGGTSLSRRGSAASLRSLDGESSRGSSYGSQAEYRERINELEKERNVEREREWNKRNSKLHRSTSSLSLRSPGERVRTHSTPTRPDSAQSLLSPHRAPGLHRRDSFSSRASSPGGSRASQSGIEDEVEQVIVHERERNWNANRPKWSPHPPTTIARSTSPMPESPSVVSRLQSNGRVRADSLRTSGTPKGEPPVHRSPATESNSFRPGTAKLPPRPSSPLPSAQTTHTPSPPQTRPRPPARPQSPLPPLASAKDITKPARANKPQTQASASISSASLGYHLSRNRTSLPPLDLENGPTTHPTTSGHPRTLSSPTPGVRPSSRASVSDRGSQIPVRSPKKIRSVPSNDRVVSSSEPPIESNGGMLAPRINFEAASPQAPEDDDQEEAESGTDDDESLSQERTPTLRTIPPPPVDTPDHSPPWSPSLPPRRKTLLSDESRLQKALGSSPVQQAISPPPSPPAESYPSHSQSIPSLLQTPPRRSSFSTARTEFQTPSPPKGLPELPGPPSSEEEEEEEEEAAKSNRTPNDECTDLDLTAMKTPRPPGAWAATPLPEREPQGRPRSAILDIDDTQYGSGLATPVASLSRASTMPLFSQTPAPPGAWMATPAPRKSILKVRFDTVLESEHFMSEDVAESSNFLTNEHRKPLERIENIPVESQETSTAEPSKFDMVLEVPEVRSRTPDLPSTPVSTRSPPRKPPSIRVLDAFGREEKTAEAEKDVIVINVNNTPRSKSGVRIVDAMGRAVEGDTEVLEGASEVQEVVPPLKHSEALMRVRQGLSDLAQGLDDMDRDSRDEPRDRMRLRELDGVSRVARETREQIAQNLQVAEVNLRSKFAPLRASMKKSRSLIPSAVDRRLSSFRVSGWMFWGILFAQFLLVLVMYRLSINRAKDLFLTTYYDPFYPDLHLYTTRPDTPHHPPTSRPSWISGPDAIHSEGWTGSAIRMWDNSWTFVGDCQKHIWETWGSEGVPKNAAWPPT